MILLGDALEVMRTLADASVDAVVTDQPYGLNFMGKEWDHGIPGEPYWREALRVAKPGAHLLAFGGTRTFHRLACAIEDAGWEIRDCLMWVYGSGFPKSLDVSKAIDKAAGAEREVVGPRVTGDGHVQNRVTGKNEFGTFETKQDGYDMETQPATPTARQWQGWGTALKPAWEPIIVARKPLDGTVAENVQRYGTGALNIDGCRIAFVSDEDEQETKARNQHGDFGSGPMTNQVFGKFIKDRENYVAPARWPANLVHDGSEEVLAEFPQSEDGVAVKHNTPVGKVSGNIYPRGNTGIDAGFGGSGSAARFFYCAKASRAEREAGLESLPERPKRWGGSIQDGRPHTPDGYEYKATGHNNHPTVKPVALMRWLVRLVTPPGGVVLDPFMDSGSTGVAAAQEGFQFIGIDLKTEYVEMARRRIEAVAPLFAKPQATETSSP